MAERTTRITIETERILILACQRATSGWCERCGSEVEFLPSHEPGVCSTLRRSPWVTNTEKAFIWEAPKEAGFKFVSSRSYAFWKRRAVNKDDKRSSSTWI
jgi:hypothetical protein